MQIDELKVTVGEVCEGYFNDAEEGVVGYDERLDIRPKYQRETAPMAMRYWTANSAPFPYVSM